MNSLDHLASLLRPGNEEGARAMSVSTRIDAVVNEIRARVKLSGKAHAPADQQVEAVRRYWVSGQIADFRDAYLLVPSRVIIFLFAVGLCSEPETFCVV